MASRLDLSTAATAALFCHPAKASGIILTSNTMRVIAGTGEPQSRAEVKKEATTLPGENGTIGLLLRFGSAFEYSGRGENIRMAFELEDTTPSHRGVAKNIRLSPSSED